jgi:hypothetical protein
VLLLQHPVLVLVFKQKLCLSLTRWLPVFSCLSVAATWSVLPSVRFDFSSGSGDQLCGPPALLLCSWVFSVLVYWGLVSLPHAPSLGQGQSSAISSLLSACYGGLLVVFQFCNIIWLRMLLAGLGDEFCGSLSSLFQAATYHPPSVRVFTESSHRDQLLAPHLLQCT